MSFNESFKASVDSGKITEEMGAWVLSVVSMGTVKHLDGMNRGEVQMIHSDIVLKCLMLINEMIDESNYCMPNPYKMLTRVVKNYCADEMRSRFKTNVDIDEPPIRKKDEFGCSLKIGNDRKFPQYAKIINEKQL